MGKICETTFKVISKYYLTTMNNSNPLISIITVSYNAQHTIEKTILSIINQTYPNLEYIIIDGGSTDGTIDIIKKYESKITKWISEPDKGIYDAMNKGIKLANGDWINFMNCGDSFYSTNTLQQVVDKLLTNKDTDVLYGNTIINVTTNKYMVLPEKLEYISNHLPFCHQSTLVKTALAKKYPFDLNYKFVADYNFFYSSYKKGYTFKYINIPISNYQIEEGFTANNAYKCVVEECIINNRNISFINKSKHKLRMFLISHLPKNITNLIRSIQYNRNHRFIKLQ